MRIGVFIPAYKTDYYLNDIIKYYEHWDEVVILKKDFKAHGQHNVRNEGVQKLSSCDYVWTVDADEIILKEDQDKLLKETIDGGYDSAFISVIDYASGNEYYKPSDKRREHKPVVLVKPGVEFYETRCVRYSKPLFTNDFNIHHLGFVLPEIEMRYKREEYWNVGNPKEAQEIMRQERIRFNPPRDIREIIKNGGKK